MWTANASEAGREVARLAAVLERNQRRGRVMSRLTSPLIQQVAAEWEKWWVADGVRGQVDGVGDEVAGTRQRMGEDVIGKFVHFGTSPITCLLD